jgi:hypothetical protein
MFDPSPFIDHAPPALLGAAAKIDRYIDRAEEHDLAELDQMLADTRAAWVEAVNVARAEAVPEAEREALAVVAVFTGLLEATRARAARLTA